MRAMLRPILPVPTMPERAAGEIEPEPLRRRPGPAFRVHLAADRHQLLGERDHQRERALGDRLLGVFRHVHHRNAARDRGRNIDRVDADAVFDDALELFGRGDHARRDRRVAHQQKVGVAHRRDQIVLADALRQQHKLAAGRAQPRIDLGAFQLAVGADGLEARIAQRPCR